MNKNQNLIKKLILLILVFFMGIILLVIVNVIFNKIILNLDEKSINLETKIKIAEYIVDDLYMIRSDFYELAITTTNEKARSIIKSKINNRINFINKSLDVLQKGGSIERVVKINVAGKSIIKKKLTYINDNQNISLENIELRPKLNQIIVMIKNLDALLVKRSLYNNKKNYENYLKNEERIGRFYKRTPTFFIRIIENSSRSLYEGNLELQTLQRTILNDKKKYYKVEVLIIILIILLVLYLGFKIARQINKSSQEILNQEIYTRGVLDAQVNIVVVSDGEKMIDANKALNNFFDKYDTFAEFQEQHACICDFFEKIDMKFFLTDRYINGKIWFEYVLENPHISYKVAMKSNDKTHFFKVNIEETNYDDKDSILIISLSDITAEFIAENKLKDLNDNLENLVNEKTKELKRLNDNLETKVQNEIEKNRKKDQTLMLQSRYASMGEMIANIAHQWRQPLSAISSTASATNLKIDLDLINKKDLQKSFTNIMNYVEFLSKTIEDFRNFFKKDRKKVEFKIIDILDNTISLIGASYKENQIIIEKNIQNKYSLLNGFPTELSQVLLNLLNNAKDALSTKELPQRLVIVNIKEDNENFIIEIIDNALGINEKYIEKIFDPYFTTKHKSQGTGIGLYMTKEIIEKHMHGTIIATNVYYKHGEKDYVGACFKITIPKNA